MDAYVETYTTDAPVFDDGEGYVAQFTSKERTVRPFVTKKPSLFVPNPNRPYLVKHLMAPNKFGMIYGPPGAGKSILGPYLAHRIAQGWTEQQEATVFKRRIQNNPVDVLYVTGEDVEGMEERLLGLSNAYGAAENLHFLGGNLNFWDDNCSDYERLMATVANIRPALIFVDTIASVFPGMDENLGSDMGRMFTKLRHVMDVCGSGLIGIHHSPKSGDTPRGHGSLEGTLELSMLVKREGNLVTARIIKNKQGASGGILIFAIGMSHLGVDADGDAMLAPVCEEADAVPLALKRMKPESGQAFAILCDLLATDKAKITPKENGFPGVPLRCVPGADWREECKRRMLTASEDASVQKRVFDTAYRELRANNLVGACDQLVWNVRGEVVKD